MIRLPPPAVSAAATTEETQMAEAEAQSIHRRNSEMVINSSFCNGRTLEGNPKEILTYSGIKWYFVLAISKICATE